MEEEIWKDIPNYNGMYQVSSLGRIRSFVKSPMHHNIESGIILKQAMCSAGYLGVSLCSNKKKKTFHTHQLLAAAFLNHISDGHKIVINHIDGNKLNNCLCNIEVVTPRYNVADGYLRKKTASKYTGVYHSTNGKKWRSIIWVNGKSLNLGCYLLEIDAANAYQAKVQDILNLKINQIVI